MRPQRRDEDTQLPQDSTLDSSRSVMKNESMASEKKDYRTLIVGGSIGIGVAISNGLASGSIESRPLRILIGAAIGGAIALIAILIMNAVKGGDKK